MRCEKKEKIEKRGKSERWGVMVEKGEERRGKWEKR